MAGGHDISLLLDLRGGYHRLFNLFHGVYIIGLALDHEMNVAKVSLPNKRLDEKVICIHTEFAGLLHNGTNWMDNRVSNIINNYKDFIINKDIVLV